MAYARIPNYQEDVVNLYYTDITPIEPAKTECNGCGANLKGGKCEYCGNNY